MPSLFPYTPEQNCKVSFVAVVTFFFLDKMHLTKCLGYGLVGAI